MNSTRWFTHRRLLLATVVFAIILLNIAVSVNSATSAADELDAVWQRVARAGAYGFRADITQRSTPLASVINAGRSDRKVAMHMEGTTDVQAELLHMTLWTEGGSVLDSASGTEIRVEGDVARARQGSGPWEEIEDFTGLFAPGGDFMAYAKAADNVVRHAPERRNTPLGVVDVTRYTFDINGRDFAVQMHGQMREQALREGLPANVRIELPRVYAEMRGTGELWVGADGLPLRQIFDLDFPPDQHEYVTSAAITVDLFDFAPVPAMTAAYRMGQLLDSAMMALVTGRAPVSMALVALGLAFVYTIVRRRRSRRVYTSVALATFIAMVAGPLLTTGQTAAYIGSQVQKQERADAVRGEAETQAELQAAVAESQMDPHMAPMDRAQVQAESQGGSRYHDERCESDPDSDLDNDTLTNLEECLLGTLLDVADSDGDGASDSLEVVGVMLGGQMWYTDPLNQDSNGDGQPDGKEWHMDPDGDGVPNLDTDDDGRPDIWDDDNDGDGVPDNQDLSSYVSTAPNTATAKTFTSEAPLQLTMDHLIPDKLVKVEFQIQPTDPEHLWYSQNVLDWPNGDAAGNMQDVDGKTFYDLDPSTSPSPNANGDVRLVPMLEIQFNNADANLPPADTCTDDSGDSSVCYPLLEQFSISVAQLTEDSSAAYVPLQLVSDAHGDGQLAFYGRMIYQASGSWGTPHHVRLVWLVQALVDVCSDYDSGGHCAAYEKYNDLQVIHSYYDDWHLTGLHLTEEHNADIALVYEEPEQTQTLQTDYDEPFYVDVLYGLLYGLDQSFMAGRCSASAQDGSCAAGAARDLTVDDIFTRFNHATNGSISDEQRWNLPNVLSVEKHDYTSIDLGMLDTTITQTVQILDDHFTPAWSEQKPITPTILIASEQQYRDLNLDLTFLDSSQTGAGNISWSGNSLLLNLSQSGDNAVAVDTMVSTKWTPYSYDSATGWSPADIQEFWIALNRDWGSSFVDPDNPGRADTYQTLAQHHYMAVYSGGGAIVQVGDVVLPAPYQQPDASIGTEIGLKGTKYTLSAMKSIFGWSDDIQEIAESLKDAGVGGNNPYGLAVGKFITQRILDLYDELGSIGFYALLTTIAILVVVTTVTAILSTTIHSTGLRWTLAITAGLLMTVFTVVSPIAGVVGLVESTIQAASEAGEIISYGTAILRTLTKASSLTAGAKLFGVLWLLLTIGIAVGFFIYAWASGGVKPGTPAFNQAIAATIATIVVAVVLFVAGLFVLGGILVAILSVIMLVMQLIGVQWTLTGKITAALTDVIYQYNVYTSAQDVTTGSLDSNLVDPTGGLISSNAFSYTLPITTTLTAASGLAGHVPPISNNSFVYALSDKTASLSTTRDAREDDWLVEQQGRSATVTDQPTTQIPLAAGVNSPTSLYLNSAYALGAQSCWLYGICSDQTISGNNSTDLGTGMYFDVLPPTLSEFVDTSPDGWAGGYVRARDGDGDGLLASRYGGLDPDDTNWDTDGDGLSDAYELTIRAKPAADGGLNLNPLNADGDNDFISDGDEIRYGTDPDNDDSDGDGIPDIQEIAYVVKADGALNVGGWPLAYAPDKQTRIWSDPLTGDADGDGLSDLFERTEDTCPTCTPWADPANPVLFNPRVWNVSPVALYHSDTSIDGYVAPGATLVYTTTTVNNLTGGQELVGDLSLHLPDGFNLSGGALEHPVDISSGSQQSLLSTITAINTSTSMTGALVSTMRLTDFDTTVWAWDAPIANSTIPTASVHALAATSLSEWSQPGLLVTTETTASGVPHLVGYLADSNAIVGAPHYIFNGDSGDTLTAPAIACADDGVCLVVVGVNAVDKPGQLVSIRLDKHFSATPATQLVWAAETNIAVSAPAIAGNGTDFLVGWATADGQGYVDYVSAAGIPNPAISPAALPGVQTGDITLSLDGDGYLAGWVQSGALQRAAIEVTVDITPTVTAGAAIPIGAGTGWPAGAPVRQVYDPISRQALLLYRSSDARLHGRLVSTTGTSDAIEIDAGVGDDLSGNGVQTALCADPKNGGWIAAWSSPTDDLRYYRAIGPDGALRGQAQTRAGSGPPLALLCNAAQPILELEFDESSGSTEFIDASSFDHNATCTGACPEAGVGGRFGRAVRFNGIDAALSIPNSEDFNFGASQDFTVSFWVIADADQPTQTAGDNDMVEKWSGSGGYPFVVRYDRATGTVLGSRYDGRHNPVVASGTAIDDGEFHHVVFVKRGGYLYLYIDGEQSGPRVPDTTTGPTINASALYLGKRGDNTNHFAGTLDALRIYNRALSNEEIGGIFDAAAAIYDLDEVVGSQGFVDASGNELNGACRGDTCPIMGGPGVAYTAARFDGQDDYIQIDPRKRAVTTYRFDFEAGVGSQWRSPGIMELDFDSFNLVGHLSEFPDSTGSGHSATCEGSSCPAWGGTGHSGYAVYFDGLTQYAIVKNSSAFNFTTDQDFTVAFWVQVDEQKDLHRADNSIVEKWGNYGGYPFVVRLNRGPGTVSAGRTDGHNNPYVTSTARIDDGAYHHVAFVRRAANLYLYIDGVQSGEPVYDTTTGDTTNTSDLVLGMRGGGTNHFAGALDELRIFAYGMSAQNVAALFNSGQSHGTQMTADDGFPDNPLGDYYLGQFANETVALHLTDLPPHDTVEVNYQFIALGSSLVGWEGNSTDGGPDNWEWGHENTSLFRTNFSTLRAYEFANPDVPTGNYQAFPAPASAFTGTPSGSFNMCRTSSVSGGEPPCGKGGSLLDNLMAFMLEAPNLATDLPNPPGVGDNPGWGGFSNSYWDNFVVRTYSEPNYVGDITTFDSNRVLNELHERLPSAGGNQATYPGTPPWPGNSVSSYKIWKSAYDPWSGAIYGMNWGGSGGNQDGMVVPVNGTISDHTTDDITFYFKGDTSLADPFGPERWGLDNVEITLEQNDTSIAFNNSSFTIAAWAKRAVEGKNMFMISQGKEQVNQGLHFGFRDSNAFTCAFSGDDLNTAPVTWDNEWHHWVCTYDVSTNVRTIYRDGVQIAQDTAAAPLTVIGPTIIGAYLDKTDGFQGDIDEIGVWRTALSDAAVAELYNKIKVEDQSVMTAIVVTTDDTGATLRTDTLTLRETATRAGTVAQDIERVLTIDADKPVVCAAAAGADAHCPPQDQYVNGVGSLVISGVATDTTSYIRQVEVNPGSGFIPAAGTGTWSYAWDMGGLSDGQQSLSVRAIDAVGNVSDVYAVKLIVDRTPPEVALDHSRPERAQRNAQGRWLVPLSGTVSEPMAGSKPGSGIAEVEVLLDGAGELAGLAWQPATIADGTWAIDYELPPFDSSGQSLASPTGVYTVSVRATDRISNTTPAAAYSTGILTLDQDGPDVTQTDPTGQVTSIQQRYTLRGRVSDASAIATMEVNLVPAEQVDALRGATLYLPFDEPFATAYFADASGSGNAATCRDACPTVIADGKQDGAITLNGVNQSLSIPDGPGIDFAHDQDFTVAFWVRVATQVDTENGDNDIVEKWSDVGSYPFVVRLNRATGQIIGSRFDGSNNPTITSTSAIDDGQYHHVAFVKRGGSLYLYIDGVHSGDPVPDTTTGDTTNDSTLYLGMRGNTGNYFAGELDELLIYNRGLAEYEVANLLAYGDRIWTTATFASGNWTYIIPEGPGGGDGIYQINVRGTDSLGNVTPLGQQRVWRGEIDTKGPDVHLTAVVDNSGAIPSVSYECTATDFNLVQSHTCIPWEPATQPSFGPEDMLLTTYDQVDAWYAATISDTARLYGIDATQTFSGTVDEGVQVYACDLYNHCTTTSVEIVAAPVSLGGVEVLDPSPATVLTTTAPVMLAGDAYARNGLQKLAVTINGETVHTRRWQHGDADRQTWRFMWTPPAEGIYHVQAGVDDYTGHAPRAAAQQDSDVPVGTAPDSPRPETAAPLPALDAQLYLPFVASGGAASAGTLDQWDVYLPLVMRDDAALPQDYASNVATYYVDLRAPAVTLERTALTAKQALGERVFKLTGTAEDSVKLHRVDVRVGDGHWHRAGLQPDGTWQWLWVFDRPPAGERYHITVRATDLAGHVAEVTEQVTVDSSR